MSDDEKPCVRGSLKWYNQQKGYGFLQLPSGGLDIFIHAQELRKSGVTRPLINGEEVNFTISSGPKGQFATGIKPVKE